MARRRKMPTRKGKGARRPKKGGKGKGRKRGKVGPMGKGTGGSRKTKKGTKAEARQRRLEVRRKREKTVRANRKKHVLIAAAVIIIIYAAAFVILEYFPRGEADLGDETDFREWRFPGGGGERPDLNADLDNPEGIEVPEEQADIMGIVVEKDDSGWFIVEPKREGGQSLVHVDAVTVYFVKDMETEEIRSASWNDVLMNDRLQVWGDENGDGSWTATHIGMMTGMPERPPPE